jgi:hypothetical protein
MAQRLIRDCTDSDKINKISRQAECFFYRLMMKADDYGNYHGDPRLLKSSLYPLLENITVQEISNWVNECLAVQGQMDGIGLIILYEHKGKQFIHILNFGQRLRQARKRFPDAPNIENSTVRDLTATRAPEVEEKYEVEVEVEAVTLLDQFNIFWKLYDKQVKRNECEHLWCRISADDRKKIIEYCPKYVASTPDKKFRKNPETFLFNEGWNDEIIVKAPDPKLPPPTPAAYVAPVKKTGLTEDRIASLLKAEKERLEKMAKEYKPGPEQLPSDNRMGSRLREMVNKRAPKP